MNPILEEYLWNNIENCADYRYDPCRVKHGKTAREVIKEMLEMRLIQSPKQAWCTLEKWLKKRKWNYGTSLDLGWKEIRHLNYFISEEAKRLYGIYNKEK